MTNTVAELTILRNTDTGQVISAKASLEQFLSYAKSRNHKAMWNTLYSDSRKDYKNESDFESNNIIAPKADYYLLSSYYLGSGKILSSWKTYSGVIEIQVILVKDLDPLAGAIVGLIPFIGSLAQITTNTEVETWNAHLIKVGNDWTIYAEREVTK